jgi:hypothetical protein
MACNSKSAFSVSLLFFWGAVTAGWTQDQAITLIPCKMDGWIGAGRRLSPGHAGLQRTVLLARG